MKFLALLNISVYKCYQKYRISDSGSIPEEASILNFKSIILRDTFERQEIFNKTSSIVSKLNLENFKKVFNIELKKILILIEKLMNMKILIFQKIYVE